MHIAKIRENKAGYRLCQYRRSRDSLRRTGIDFDGTVSCPSQSLVYARDISLFTMNSAIRSSLNNDSLRCRKEKF